jgi:purine-binding chemotaxis protein CheW
VETLITETVDELSSRSTLLAAFFVRDALCALDASTVQEVIRVEAVTPVRHSHAEVTGVMNLRGRIVTLLDLAMILGLGRTEISRDSRVFIVEDRNEFLGLVVDRVSEVVEIQAGQEEPLPLNIPDAQARYFTGVCRFGAQVISILNPAEVLNETRL